MQRNLLDTHTLLWFLAGSEDLSTVARKSIEAPDAVNFVSIASLWEIAIKVSLGKLELRSSLNQLYSQLAANGFDLLPIAFDDTALVASLPFHHRDPFDRILVAQALNGGLTLLSKDRHMDAYGVQKLW